MHSVPMEADEKTCTLYVIECENGKFYVGKIAGNDVLEVKVRYDKHEKGEGAEWTRIHRPLRVIESKTNMLPEDEDSWVKRYMMQFGPANVRGGSYSRPDQAAIDEQLEAHPSEQAKREARGAQDRCFKCGSSDHFVRDCTNADAVGSPDRQPVSCHGCGGVCHYIAECPFLCEEDEPPAKRSRPGECSGGVGHFVAECPLLVSASDDVDNESSNGNHNDGSNADSCERCGRGSHDSSSCYATFHVNGWVLPVVCARCGRDSHATADCYASFHVDGRALSVAEAEDDAPTQPFGGGGASCFTQELICVRCGRDSHTIADCYASKHVDGSLLPEHGSVHVSSFLATQVLSTIMSSSGSSGSAASGSSGRKQQPGCSRCGRKKHTAAECYASFHADGSALPERVSVVFAAEPPSACSRLLDPFCARCGRDSHAAADCYASKHVNGSLLPTRSSAPSPPSTRVLSRSSSGGSGRVPDMPLLQPALSAWSSSGLQPSGCARCGRDSHTAADCYASKHVDGSLLPSSAPSPPSKQALSRSTSGGGGGGGGRAATKQQTARSSSSSSGRSGSSGGSGCARCGRDSHTAAKCFAKTHADGYAL